MYKLVKKHAPGSRKKIALSITLIYNTTFWYLNAVEEAFRFGWIDSTTKILRMSFPSNALQSADRIATGQNLIKGVADDLKIVITADSGRAVLLDMSENGLLTITNILVVLQSDETIWAKLFEFATGCIE